MACTSDVMGVAEAAKPESSPTDVKGVMLDGKSGNGSVSPNDRVPEVPPSAEENDNSGKSCESEEARECDNEKSRTSEPDESKCESERVNGDGPRTLKYEDTGKADLLKCLAEDTNGETRSNGTHLTVNGDSKSSRVTQEINSDPAVPLPSTNGDFCPPSGTLLPITSRDEPPSASCDAGQDVVSPISPADSSERSIFPSFSSCSTIIQVSPPTTGYNVLPVSSYNSDGQGYDSVAAVNGGNLGIMGEGYADDSSLAEQQEGKGKRIIKCSLCLFTSSTEAGLTKHAQTCHMPPDPEFAQEHPEKCELCEFRAKKKFLIRRHLRLHGYHVCTQCTYLCMKEEELAAHMEEKHSDTEPTRHCQKCQKNFKSDEREFAEHLQVCDGNPMWVCQECGREFKYRSPLLIHMNRHLKGDQAKTYFCDQCEYKSLYRCNLMKHAKTVHPTGGVPKPFGCSQCGKSFSSNSYLVSHLATHQPEKAVPCTSDGCGAVFRTNKDLSMHFSQVHSTSQNRCAVEGCGLTFTKLSMLKRHEKTHIGERKFVCDWPGCSKRFRHADNLRVHRLTHTGEKPILCPVSSCEFRCRQKSSLQYHMKKAHPEHPPVLKPRRKTLERLEREKAERLKTRQQQGVGGEELPGQHVGGEGLPGQHIAGTQQLHPSNQGWGGNPGVAGTVAGGQQQHPLAGHPMTSDQQQHHDPFADIDTSKLIGGQEYASAHHATGALIAAQAPGFDPGQEDKGDVYDFNEEHPPASVPPGGLYGGYRPDATAFVIPDADYLAYLAREIRSDNVRGRVYSEAEFSDLVSAALARLGPELLPPPGVFPQQGLHIAPPAVLASSLVDDDMLGLAPDTIETLTGQVEAGDEMRPSTAVVPKKRRYQEEEGEEEEGEPEAPELSPQAPSMPADLDDLMPPAPPAPSPPGEDGIDSGDMPYPTLDKSEEPPQLSSELVSSLLPDNSESDPPLAVNQPPPSVMVSPSTRNVGFSSYAQHSAPDTPSYRLSDGGMKPGGLNTLQSLEDFTNKWTPSSHNPNRRTSESGYSSHAESMNDPSTHGSVPKPGSTGSLEPSLVSPRAQPAAFSHEASVVASHPCLPVAPAPYASYVPESLPSQPAFAPISSSGVHESHYQQPLVSQPPSLRPSSDIWSVPQPQTAPVTLLEPTPTHPSVSLSAPRHDLSVTDHHLDAAAAYVATNHYLPTATDHLAGLGASVSRSSLYGYNSGLQSVSDPLARSRYLDYDQYGRSAAASYGRDAGTGVFQPTTRRADHLLGDSVGASLGLGRDYSHYSRSPPPTLGGASSLTGAYDASNPFAAAATGQSRLDPLASYIGVAAANPYGPTTASFASRGASDLLSAQKGLGYGSSVMYPGAAGGPGSTLPDLYSRNPHAAAAAAAAHGMGGSLGTAGLAGAAGQGALLSEQLLGPQLGAGGMYAPQPQMYQLPEKRPDPTAGGLLGYPPAPSQFPADPYGVMNRYNMMNRYL